MFWADKVAEEIINSGNYKPYWVDDMFTPSGHPHVGSLRGPLVHDAVYKALREKGQEAKWTYVTNDFDPIDGLPAELEESHSEYMGIPVRMAPSPVEGYDNFGDYFAKQYQEVLRELGVESEFVSSWDMYHEGRFNDVIRIALDNSEKIQDIYEKVSGSKKREKGWLPLQVICENCGRVGTTRVHDWDGETVAYTCEVEMVKWSKGCGHTGRISPFDGNGKLPWKVDWPAHWKVMGVTIEGAGKDHSSAGGSRDIAKALCSEVFNYPNPFNLPYEFMLIGGKKMSSSKGLGLKARDLADMLPLEVGRFLFLKTDYKKQVEFDPQGTLAIPNLFDEFLEAAAEFTTHQDTDSAKAFEYSIIDKDKIYVPIRFLTLAQWVQMPNMEEKIKEEGLEEWAKYARIWVEKFAPEEYRFEIKKELPKNIDLSEKQKELLRKTSEFVGEIKDGAELQTKIYEIGKSLELSSGETFEAFYKVLIGKNHGPKLAWLILSLDSEFVKKRFEEAASISPDSKEETEKISILDKPEIFSIDENLSKNFPSISVGIAVIKNVSINEKNEELEKEKKELLKSLENLTTEELGQYPEIVAYRKLYKEMGIDWHSRRPSPEALLRRVALKKGLYDINTCVDAYNLVVMKNRISVGAFDLDKVGLPTILRFARNDEEILLLGEENPIKYTEKEIAYFDKGGGYNMDFNYRDAQRTAVDDSTKNLFVNVDGVNEITPKDVGKTLKEAVEKIMKYCGGEIEVFGVITA
jgi:lysyl-tRNA synthetase class 1